MKTRKMHIKIIMVASVCVCEFANKRTHIAWVKHILCPSRHEVTECTQEPSADILTSRVCVFQVADASFGHLVGRDELLL